MHLVVNIFATLESQSVISKGIEPFIKSLSLIALLVCTLFLVIGGFRYITSSGNPEALLKAKKIIKNSVIGLVIVLGATTITSLLSSSYGPVSGPSVTSVPAISAINPSSNSSGIIDIIIKTIAGVFNDIIQTVATPFLNGLSYFTKGTPLIESNASAFNLWLIVTGAADGLFTLVIILLGFHVMSFSSLGLDEVSMFKLLPKIGLAYLLMNSSIFLIDALVSLSNLMIKVVSQGQSVTSLWQALTTVVQKSSGDGLATLIVMIIFLIFSVILIVYYIGRLVTIYLGAVLAPLIILIWLLPGLRDFAVSATKRYLVTIFVLFVHVVILELAASIILGIVSGSSDSSPLMALLIGLATLICLIKTQGVMSQLSYAATGPKIARQIGQRLILNMNYITSGASTIAAPLMPTFLSTKNEYPATKYSSVDNKKTITPTASNSPKSDKKS